MNLSTYLSKRSGILDQTLLALVITGFILTLFYHIRLLLFPFPHGYREGGELLQTAYFMAGVNPYDISMIPRHGNLYGFIFGLVSIPFVKLTGSYLLGMEITVGLFILGNLFFMYRVMMYYGIERITSLYLLLILYLLYLHRENAVVNCSMVGMLWYLLSVYLPFLTRFKWKGLFLSMVFAIIGFYTKGYFVFGAICVATYLFLFVSKRRGLIYFGAFMLMLILSAMMVQRLFPTYFLQVILGQYTASANIFSYTLYQVYMFSTRLIPFVTLIFIISLISLFNLRNIRSFLNSFFRNWSVKKLNLPLIPESIEYSLFCGMMALLVFLFKLGGNVGGYLSYLIHLVIPFLLVAAMVTSETRNKLVTKVLLLLNVVFLFYQIGIRQFPDSKEVLAWKKIETIISSNQNILGSPVIAPVVMQQGKRVYDTGLNESTAVCTADSSLNASIPLNAEIIRRSRLFHDSVNRMIETGAFDVILLNQEGTWLADPAFIGRYYDVVDSIVLPQAHCVRFWKLMVWKSK